MTRSLLFATLLVLCLPLAVRAGEVSVSPPHCSGSDTKPGAVGPWSLSFEALASSSR